MQVATMNVNPFTAFSVSGRAGFASDRAYPGFIADGVLWIANDHGKLVRFDDKSSVAVHDLEGWRRRNDGRDPSAVGIMAEKAEALIEEVAAHIGNPAKGKGVIARAAFLGIARELADAAERPDLVQKIIDGPNDA